MRKFSAKGTTVLTRATIAVVAVWFSGAVGAAGLFTPTTGSMTEPRYGHTATALANGKVLMVGGYDGAGDFYLPIADLYDPATGLFSATGAMSTTPVGRIGHRAIKLANGKVLVLGGNDDSVYLATAELYGSRLRHVYGDWVHGKGTSPAWRCWPTGRCWWSAEMTARTSRALKSTIPRPARSRRPVPWERREPDTPPRGWPTGRS